MQGRDDGQRQFLDVESVAGHLLPPGSVFGFLLLNLGLTLQDGTWSTA